MSGPPADEKKERKNDEAANAIDRPKTIWIKRRKPPEVSPNASVSPVTMMMITAMIFETGPSIDWRICWSGCSHGICVPAARARCASPTRESERVASQMLVSEESLTASPDGLGGRLNAV